MTAQFIAKSMSEAIRAIADLRAELDIAYEHLHAAEAECDALRAVIEAAKALRERGSVLSLMVLNPPTISDAKAVNEFLGLFDGPLQRDLDAALAALEGDK